MGPLMRAGDLTNIRESCGKGFGMDCDRPTLITLTREESAVFSTRSHLAQKELLEEKTRVRQGRWLQAPSAAILQKILIQGPAKIHSR